MDFPQNFKTFVTSILAFFIQVSPDLNLQISEPGQPLSSRTIEIESPQLQRLQKESSTLLAAQQHQQWVNAVLAFCFSFVLGVSFQFVGTNDFSFILLSFLILLTFILTLGALFVHPNCTRTSQSLEKVAILLAAAAFCHTLSIPLSFELKFAFWAVFLLSLLILIIFKFFCHNTA